MTLIPVCSLQVHGSQRWFNFFGFAFQPSEFLKMTFIVYLAFLLTKKQYQLRSLTKTYFPLLIILGVTTLILLKQPDFGMAITFMLTASALMFIAQIPSKYLVVTGACLIPLVGMLVLGKAYRLKRILTFLNPWSDPLGAGFQIIQSLIAIGSGNLWGVGISNSQQKFFYLPMQHTDFIFSIIAEETGFFGSLIIILCFLFFLYIGLRIAWQLHDRFAMLVVVGFILLINIQVIINLAVATGLVPTKGIGLPFVSYGNTALVANLCMVGLILNYQNYVLVNKVFFCFF
jgi:cell division protein FtsW